MVKKGKGTKGWRRNSNIKDVEEALEEIRKEERMGGPISKKKDEDLFFVDTSGGLNEQTRQAKKGLKIDDILNPTSQIPAAGVQKAKTQKISIQDKKKIEKIASHLVKSKEVAKKKSKKSSKEKSGYDMWSESSEPKEVVLGQGFNNPMEKPIIKRKTPLKTESTVPAVRAAHPGNSYHPEEEAHSALLEQAASFELQKQIIKKKLDKKVENVVNNVGEHVRKRGFLRSAIDESGGLLYPEELRPISLPGSEEIFSNIQREEGEEEEESEPMLKKPVRAEDRKSKTQRNKEKKKLLQHRAEKKAQRRLKAASVPVELMRKRLDKLVRNLDRKEEALVLRKEKAKLKKMEQLGLPKQLSKQRFVAPKIDLKLKSALPSNLRTLKTEGNLLSDRMRSLQERNIVEVRVRQRGKQRYARKVIDKKEKEFRRENDL